MKLFVGGLTPWTTEHCLTERFSRYGQVDSVKIVRDGRSGQSRRFGFVEMPREREAKKAARALHGAEHQGLYMSVVPKASHGNVRRDVPSRSSFLHSLLMVWI